MPKRTPLYPEHLADGGRMVDFAGWELPLHYGSQLEEHRAVRECAGLFDVSHMTVIDLAGPRARDFLRVLVNNDVDRIGHPGGALYGCLLNPAGGIIDDLIVYRWSEREFRLVTNAATRAKVTEWIRRQGEPWGIVPRVAEDLAMVAVQGPRAREWSGAVLAAGLAEAATALPPFSAVRDGRGQVARTGYTGEDGYEILVPAEAAADLWRRLRQAGAAPCGLAARDSLRLEAGMRLYGADMDETVTPAATGLQWTCDLRAADRPFIGREAVAAEQAEGPRQELAGLTLEDKGVLRAGQTVEVPGLGSGIITSGGYSPVLGRSVAFARLPAGAARIGSGRVTIRDQVKTVRIGTTRFLQQRAEAVQS